MTQPQPRYGMEEHTLRGTDLYEHQVRFQVEAGHQGRIVAIDVDTGAFDVADDTLTACRRLLARHPDAQIWCVRVGHSAVHRFGRTVGSGGAVSTLSCQNHYLRQMSR